MSYLDPQAINNLKALQERTGKNICGQLITLFRDSTPEVLARMKNQLENAQYEELAREAHSLKSSSGNLGAAYMSERCHLIEVEIMEKTTYDTNVIKQLFSELEESYDPTLEAILQAA